MKKIFLFLLLMSCTSINSTHESTSKTLKFDENLTFEEFKKKLIKYAEIASYPDID